MKPKLAWRWWAVQLWRHRRQWSTSRVFRRRPGSVSASRRFALRCMAGWGLSPGPAAHITAELASNALVHAESAFLVSLSRRPGCVRIEVADPSAGVPVLDSAHILAGSGRGLLTVAQLADRWGYDPLTPGKRVWAEFSAETSTVHAETPAHEGTEG